MRIILASTSPYRRALLERLGLAFDVRAPLVDETPQPGESATALVRRLARAKALAVSDEKAGALVIGSDQVATFDGLILGKPGAAKRTVEQLSLFSGKRVQFLTGLCVLSTASGDAQVDVVPYTLEFRALTRAQIEAYVAHERPYDCAGGFKSEGLGIALLRAMHGADPTALIGLPLIRLTAMLAQEGVDVLRTED